MINKNTCYWRKNILSWGIILELVDYAYHQVVWSFLHVVFSCIIGFRMMNSIFNGSDIQCQLPLSRSNWVRRTELAIIKYIHWLFIRCHHDDHNKTTTGLTTLKYIDWLFIRWHHDDNNNTRTKLTTIRYIYWLFIRWHHYDNTNIRTELTTIKYIYWLFIRWHDDDNNNIRTDLTTIKYIYWLFIK